MKLLLCVVATLALLHVAHSFTNYDKTAKTEMEGMVDQLEASSQTVEETREVMQEVRKRLQQFMAYSQETVELMQHIHPEGTDSSHHPEGTNPSSQELFTKKFIGIAGLVIAGTSVLVDVATS